MAELLTLKLHLLVQHLPDIELCLGPMAKQLEYWIERIIQYAKDSIEGRARTKPEQTFWKDELLNSQLRSWKRRYPDHCLSVAEERALQAKMRKATKKRAEMDIQEKHEPLCLGAGTTSVIAQPATPTQEAWTVDEDMEWNAVMKLMRSRVDYMRTRGWPVFDDDDDSVGCDPFELESVLGHVARYRHSRAILTSDVRCGSRLQSVARTRSSWFYLQFPRPHHEHVMLNALYFLRLEYKGSDWGTEHGLRLKNGDALPWPPKPLRFVIAKAFRAYPVDAEVSSPCTNQVPGIVPEFLFVPDTKWAAGYARVECQLLHSITTPSPSLLWHEAQDMTQRGLPWKGWFMRTGKSSAAWGEQADEPDDVE